MVEISVAEDVLTAQPNPISELPGVFTGWLGMVAFLLSPHPSTDSNDISELAEAAQAAVQRFRLVSEEGVEMPGRWARYDTRVIDGVLGPAVLEDAIVIGGVGTDEVTAPQAATMLRIVLGELHSRACSGRVSCPPTGIDLRQLPRWRADLASTFDERPGGPDDSRVRWYVHRSVRCLTTTGVPYIDQDWLRTDGTWSRNPSGAVTFVNTPEGKAELMEFLRPFQEAYDPSTHGRPYGLVNGLLLDPEAENWSVQLPADEIRDHGHAWNEPRSED